MKFRRPGVQEADVDRVLLVCKHRTTGAERIDWWPSVAEAERSGMIVLEVRDKIHIEKNKSNWIGLWSLALMVLGKSGTTDAYLRKRPLDQREFFEAVDTKTKKRTDVKFGT